MLTLIPALSPSVESLMDYYNAFNDIKKDMNSYALTLIKQGCEEYKDWVTIYEKYMYFLVDDSNPNYLIGYGSINNSDVLDYHKSYLNDGNIAYGIRPNERDKGYGTKLLALLLKKCKSLKMSEVCVSCYEENKASKSIIEKNGGEFDSTFYASFSGNKSYKYWIPLSPKIIIKLKRLVISLKQTD